MTKFGITYDLVGACSPADFGRHDGGSGQVFCGVRGCGRVEVEAVRGQFLKCDVRLRKRLRKMEGW